MRDSDVPVVVLGEAGAQHAKEMEMSEEHHQILSMLAEGKVTVEEAERLLSALGQQRPVPEKEPGGQGAGKTPKYLRVLVQDGDENVNIRVPLRLVRAGMKLKALLPKRAQEKIDSKLGEKGIDLGKVRTEDMDDLLSTLNELQVNVDGDGKEKVRIFCE